MSEELTASEMDRLRSVCDDGRQLDEVSAEVRAIFADRFAAMGMTETHSGQHRCFACDMARAIRPLTEASRRMRERAERAAI